MENTVKQISPMEMASILAKNNQDEQEAIKNYMDLLNKITNSGVVGGNQYKEVTAAITEIIADEMNHSQKLSELATKFSQIQPA